MRLESEKEQQPTDVACEADVVAVCVCVSLKFPNKIGSISSFHEYFPVV